MQFAKILKSTNWVKKTWSTLSPLQTSDKKIRVGDFIAQKLGNVGITFV